MLSEVTEKQILYDLNYVWNLKKENIYAFQFSKYSLVIYFGEVFLGDYQDPASVFQNFKV